MAFLLDTGIFSTVGSNSSVLSGAKLYFYKAGTSTPQDTYTSSALDPLSKNSNPVIASASGRFSAIWFPNSLYKIILKDANDVTLETRDNVGPTFPIDVAATTGSSLIGFKHAPVSATARTIQDRERDTVHAKDFGAVFDGVTDDTAGIQAAIDYVSSIGGGTVELPAGAAKTQKLTRPENVYIRGVSRYGTRLVAPTSYNAPLIESVGSLDRSVNRGGVSSLAIVGSGKANTGMVGIKEAFCNRSTIRDIDIFGTYKGMWAENVWQCAWDNIHVHGGGTDQSYIGFYMGPKDPTVGVSNAVFATGCIAQGVEKYGWRLENFNGSKFQSCEGMNGEHAWYLGDPSSGSEIVQFGHFINCLGDTTSGHTWRLEKGAASALQRLSFANCWSGTSTAGSTVYVAGASQLTFSNWQIASAYLHGIHFNQSSRCLVTGSNIRDWNTPTGASCGIRLQDSSIIKVTACDIYTTTTGTGKGFMESGTSNYNTLTDSNSAGGWTLTGASSTQSNNTTA